MESENQLAAYGYSLSSEAEIVAPNGRHTRLFVSRKKGRAQVRREDKSLLWSGSDLGDFLASFWFARPIHHA